MLGTMGRKVQQTAAKTDCESTGEDFAQHLSNDLGNSDNGLGLLDDRKFVGRGLGACYVHSLPGCVCRLQRQPEQPLFHCRSIRNPNSDV